MNKLLVNNIKNIQIDKDTKLYYNYDNQEETIIVNIAANVTFDLIEISTNSKISYQFHVADNSIVNITRIIMNCSDNISIDINGGNTEFNLVTSGINLEDNYYTQLVEHKVAKSNSYVSNNIVNFAGDFIINVSAKVDKNINDCNTRQDNYILNIGDGNNGIYPNLLIDNNFVNAYHSAYVGKFDKESLFYLETRGISSTKAYQLLILGLLTKNINVIGDDKSVIIEKIKNWLQEVNYEL